MYRYMYSHHRATPKPLHKHTIITHQQRQHPAPLTLLSPRHKLIRIARHRHVHYGTSTTHQLRKRQRQTATVPHHVSTIHHVHHLNKVRLRRTPPQSLLLTPAQQSHHVGYHTLTGHLLHIPIVHHSLYIY